jgi:hypothetical protein
VYLLSKDLKKKNSPSAMLSLFCKDVASTDVEQGQLAQDRFPAYDQAHVSLSPAGNPSHVAGLRSFFGIQFQSSI